MLLEDFKSRIQVLVNTFEKSVSFADVISHLLGENLNSTRMTNEWKF